MMRAFVLVACGLAFVLTIRLIREVRDPTPERMRAMSRFLTAFVGGSLTAVVRSVVPLALFSLWTSGFGLLVAVTGEQTVVIFTFVLGLPVVAANILVVRYAAWPRWQVPRAFRGRSEAELREWFVQDVDSRPATRLVLDGVDGATTEPDRLPIPERIQSIVLEIAGRLDSGGDELVEQARVAMVTRETPTWVDLRVPDGVRRGDWADGPLLARPTVLAPDGDPSGAIYLWVSDGALSAIEQGWFGDVPPVEWPAVGQLRWP